MQRDEQIGQAPERSGSAAEGERLPEVERRRKQIYLRTVYPLNPGIPHYLDIPSGW